MNKVTSTASAQSTSFISLTSTSPSRLPNQLANRSNRFIVCARQFNCDERGSSSLNFLIVMFLLTIVVYSMAQYLPVAWRARVLQDEMQMTVNQAAALNRPIDWAEKQIRASIKDNNLPPDAYVLTRRDGAYIEANVQFAQSIPLPGYTYNFQYNRSVRSSAGLSGAP